MHKKLLHSAIISLFLFSCSKKDFFIAKIKAHFHTAPSPQSKLAGIWLGYYIESSDFCKTLTRMQMIVTVDSGQFKGIVTARDLTGYPIDTLIGTLNKDTTELTLQPYYGTTYENPWKVSSDSITGGIQSPPSMVRSYEFAKQ